MSTIERINLKDKLGKHLQTRESVSYITYLLDSNKKLQLVLDFNGVENISRSFMDELIKEIEKYKSQINIDFVTMKENQIVLFEVVSKTNKITTRADYKNSYPYYKIADFKDLDTILSNF